MQLKRRVLVMIHWAIKLHTVSGYSQTAWRKRRFGINFHPHLPAMNKLDGIETVLKGLRTF